MSVGTYTAHTSFPAVTHTSGLPNAPHVFPVTPKSIVFVLGRDTDAGRRLRAAGFTVVELAAIRDIRIQLHSNTATCVVYDMDIAPNETKQSIQHLWRLAIGMQVIAISNDVSSFNSCRALRAGASEFCAKSSGADDLEEIVKRSLDRDRTGNPSPMEVRTRIASLTEREREVVENCLQGTVTKVIAKHLDVTYQTIDKHRKKALRKMGVGSMVELSCMLYRTTLRAVGCDYEFTA